MKPLSLVEARIQVVPHASFTGSRQGALVFQDVWLHEDRLERPDVAVFVGYRRSESAIADELAAAFPTATLMLVGDCVAPRRLSDAVADGSRAARTI